jgi:hypothetical protein
MDEARAVIERLNRIEALDREGAPARTLLAGAARARSRGVGAGRARAREAVDAVERCKTALEQQILSV